MYKTEEKEQIQWIQEQVQPADVTSMEQAKARWISVAKPLFSLGKLETAVIRMAGMKRTADVSLDKKGLVIMCADNGVVAEGVTQTGQEVTAIVADNFTKDAASVVIMSKMAGVEAFPIDIGMVTDVESVTVPAWKVSYGTKNFAKEPAMEISQVLQAIQIGIQIVKEKREAGYEILATGEMGIGNTTTSSAVAAVLLGVDADLVTGRGAGLTTAGLERKSQVIKEAICRYQLRDIFAKGRAQAETGAPAAQAEAAIQVLAAVGGLDIAGMVGLFLGGAIYGIPILVDGFISSVAALCAAEIAPVAKEYMMASHVSKEPAGRMVLDALGLDPFLFCDMCLGEGSGAVAVLPVLEMGLQVYRQMGTFQDIHVEQYEVLK